MSIISTKPWFKLSLVDQYSPLLPTAGYYFSSRVTDSSFNTAKGLSAYEE